MVAPPLPEVSRSQDVPDTVRWPIYSIPLPNKPRVAVSVDYFGPLSIIPRGNAYTLLSCAGTPGQHYQANRQYHLLCINAA